MKKVQAINNRQLAITKNNALLELITPAGISRTAVRGFFASKFLSSQRLKAMAAERAKIMQRMTKKKIHELPKKNNFVFENTERLQGSNTLTCGIRSKLFIPKKNPINAKGIAKMMWENFTRLR